MRILFFGDGAWAAASLRRLAAEGHEILGVLRRARPTSPDLAEEAGRLGLTVEHQDANSPEFVARVRDLGPDLNLSVSYDQILRAPIRDTARQRVRQLHAGSSRSTGDATSSTGRF